MSWMKVKPTVLRNKLPEFLQKRFAEEMAKKKTSDYSKEYGIDLGKYRSKVTGDVSELTKVDKESFWVTRSDGRNYRYDIGAWFGFCERNDRMK